MWREICWRMTYHLTHSLTHFLGAHLEDLLDHRRAEFEVSDTSLVVVAACCCD
jgi:hypothetical protein